MDDIDVELNETGPTDVLVAERCISFDAFVITLVGMLNESLVLLVDGGNRLESNGFFIAFGPGWFAALFVVPALDDVGYKLNGNDDPNTDELDEYGGMYLDKLYAADDDDDVNEEIPLNTFDAKLE